MEARIPMGQEGDRSSGHSMRNFMAVMFRQRRAVGLTFLTVMMAAIAAALFLPAQHEAEMKILIERDRQDAVVTPDPTTATNPGSVRSVTEEEVNSEVDLLQSNDLLEKVVTNCGLDAQIEHAWYRWLIPAPADKNIIIAEAVDQLKSHLRIDPPKKSNLITVTYRSFDPVLAARVLNTMSGFYLDKHAVVHRPAGTYEFFQKETARLHAQLNAASQQLVDFNRQAGIVNPDLEKAGVLQQEATFEAALKQTKASIAETQDRIKSLETQLETTPQRKTTQIRTSATLLEQLEASLFDLQQQRLQLLGKFEPTYRPVVEIDKQIASTQAAIAEANKTPIKEETTDGDPTYAWLVSELAKAKTDLASLRAGALEQERIVQQYQARAHDLDQKGMKQQELARNQKAAEESYLTYLHKQEESRMSDALDQHQIVDVAVAEAATVPYLPVFSGLAETMLGLLLAIFLSIGMAYAADHWDHSFRTPEEVEGCLQMPVLAAIPKSGD